VFSAFIVEINSAGRIDSMNSALLVPVLIRVEIISSIMRVINMILLEIDIKLTVFHHFLYMSIHHSLSNNANGVSISHQI